MIGSQRRQKTLSEALTWTLVGGISSLEADLGMKPGLKLTLPPALWVTQDECQRQFDATVYMTGAVKPFYLWNVQITYSPRSPNTIPPKNMLPIRENAKSNGNNHSVCRKNIPGLHLLVCDSTREVGQDIPEDSGSRNMAVYRDFHQGSTASGIIMYEGCLGERKSSHV